MGGGRVLLEHYSEEVVHIPGFKMQKIVTINTNNFNNADAHYSKTYSISNRCTTVFL